MAKINYKGMELEEYTSDKPVIFDPPRRCVTIRINGYGQKEAYNENRLMAYIPEREFPAIIEKDSFKSVALLPEKPTPRRATNRELAKWLAQGNGEWCNCIGDSSRAAIEWWYDQGHSETKANNVFVRKWDDTEWHVPDVLYMNIK